ncbi:hypothetical protein JCM10908_005525 [Rhodotorula pacifica]|uniref:uncharacterized protein n=1 Tax=Rhodotorula pacifica TaxID=1495444 RepID=UPI003170C69B
MPVGHVRINDPKPNPNDNITFIRVLEDRPDSDVALKILEALAAQFKPIMKEWGFGVNSLVEYEWNPTFAGRNWNAGEVVEIVLRRRDGSFAPYQFLLYVMCHELAHIREMNHSWAFQKVNSQIRASLARLRAQNYYGDGFWSAGRSLKYPNAEVPAAETELATLTCGGANKKSRGRRRRRTTGEQQQQRERGSAVKLGTTGRQTAIPRKAGGRVAKKNAFVGEGQVLSEDPSQSTFKRRAQAQKAIEARAAAAEARIAAEKRARAAEARVKKEKEAGPSSQKKPKIEIDLVGSDSDSGPEPDTEDDDDDNAHDVGGGWETDEEDKPALQLDEEEKRWLESDMRDWEKTFANDGEDVKPAVNTDSSKAPSKGKGKARAASPIASGSGASKRPRKASPPPPAPPKKGSSRSAFDIEDLTAEERAWLEADMAITNEGVEDAGSGGGGGKVAYMAMPNWMGGEPASSRGRSKRSSDVEVIIADSCDEDEDDFERVRRPSTSNTAPSAGTSAPLVRSYPRPKGAKGSPAASPSKHATQDESPILIATRKPARKQPAFAPYSPSPTKATKRPDPAFIKTQPPSKKPYDQSYAPFASTSRVTAGKATIAKEPAAPSFDMNRKKHAGPAPPDDQPFAKPSKLPRQNSGNITNKLAPAEKQPLFPSIINPFLPLSARQPLKPRRSEFQPSTLPFATGPASAKSLKELATSLESTKQSTRPQPKKQRTAQQEEVVLVGLQLHAAPQQPADLSFEKQKQKTALPPQPQPSQPRAAPPAKKPYECDSDAEISSSASSVCSIPPALVNGLANLSAGEITKILDSLDKQVKYNERLAEKRKTKRPKVGQSVAASTGVRPGKKQKQMQINKGAPTNRRLSPSLGESQAEKKRPMSKQLAKDAVTCASSSRPVKTKTSKPEQRPPPQEAFDILAQAARGQQAFVAKMDAEGKLWRCGVCDFDNAAIIPTCEVCSIGSALAAREWNLPEQGGQNNQKRPSK